MSTTAQILTHEKFNRAPVIQTRIAGRLPKTVVNIYRCRRAKLIANEAEIRNANEAEIRKRCEITVIRNAIAACELATRNLRYDLAVATSFHAKKIE